MGHGGQDQHHRRTLGRESKDLVLGDVLGLLVVPVEMGEVGDVVLVGRCAGLGSPQTQRRDR